MAEQARRTHSLRKRFPQAFASTQQILVRLKKEDVASAKEDISVLHKDAAEGKALKSTKMIVHAEERATRKYLAARTSSSTTTSTTTLPTHLSAPITRSSDEESKQLRDEIKALSAQVAKLQQHIQDISPRFLSLRNLYLGNMIAQVLEAHGILEEAQDYFKRSFTTVGELLTFLSNNNNPNSKQVGCKHS